MLIQQLPTLHAIRRRIGFRYWKNPGPFGQYKDVTGPFSRFVGFWTVMIQASFSFFGAEVPGVAGGEVLNAPKVVLPRSLLLKVKTLIIVPSSPEYPLCRQENLDTNVCHIINPSLSFLCRALGSEI